MAQNLSGGCGGVCAGPHRRLDRPAGDKDREQGLMSVSRNGGTQGTELTESEVKC